ncbi:hypothetical protein [Methylocaldum sp.]|uniref:hypothetical protein n=1 Tax=Methylocaldum sp. TaxID=1969727 RepID=UPI002D6A7037|nr:hypothetical protein [Methylocaldum sp.]HYE38173.1 hypothetical protein [Methylocaldum sp.]
MSGLVKVDVFFGAEFIGSLTQYHFNTNSDRPAIQNGSVLGLCPFCGEIWLRAVHAEGLPYWRTVELPCLTHAHLWGDHAFRWGTFEHLIGDITDAPHDVLLLEFLWWCKRRGNNLLGD